MQALQSKQLHLKLAILFRFPNLSETLIVDKRDALVKESIEIEAIFGEEVHGAGMEGELHDVVVGGEGEDVEVEGVC